MQTIRAVLEDRVTTSDVAGAVVTIAADRVVVELPELEDTASVERLLGSTGRLDFVPLPPDRYGTNETDPGGPIDVVVGQSLPTNEMALFSGDQLATVEGTTDAATGLRMVTFSLKPAASKLFDEYTTGNIGHYFVIVLDGVVVSAPYIREPITNGHGTISGAFKGQEINDLVAILRSGSLTFPLIQTARDIVVAP